MTERLSDNFFETLGKPKLGSPFNLLDAYRFDLCYRKVGSGSLLDVGAYLGDFLNLAKQDNRQFYGTEINQTRVDLVNSRLETENIRLDFRNGELKQFETDFVDNVVCMETLEHIIDDRYALSELCRVAKSRVVVTVPFRENIQQVLCMHCDTYTPHSGHQHSYDFGSFSNMTPDGWRLVVEYPFAKRLTRIVSRLFQGSKAIIPILRWLDKILPGSGRWILVIFEPAK
ncbi:MAG: class I SAM-dependent methyltransferase [Bacteroidota bacterium]|nr:class I SAM-dependent methyltransferase [Bacteroidota bacterium]